MTTTRYPCPLDCGWHHNVDHTQLPAAVEVPLPAGASVESLRDAVNIALLKRTLADTEDALRAHLETHELVEWVQALTVAQRRILELEGRQITCSHAHPILSQDPPDYGPCERCGKEWVEPRYLCLGCARHLQPGQECQTARCQAELARWRAEKEQP